MSKSKKHPKPDNKEAPVIVFASIVKDERGQFTLSLMPVSYLETPLRSRDAATNAM